MGRTTNKLTAIRVERIKAKGRYSDGGGLYLRVSPALNKSWVFRSVRDGIATEVGLGPFPLVSLSIAREQAAECRRFVVTGLNIKAERERTRARKKTFGEIADEYLKIMAPRWTYEKTRWQWRSTLNDFCGSIRKRRVSDIDTDDILRLLRPIWEEKPETAGRIRMRLESVLDYARTKGHRDGENPARWRGHLANLLPARQKLSRGNHPAMSYNDVPGFVRRLQSLDTISARGLELLILTACRTTEVREARWSEVDFEGKVWTIPAERMKARVAHRVPLTKEMLAILRPLHGTRMSDFIFPGQKSRMPLSNMAFKSVMKRLAVTDATPHGFRSSFRDWCGDCTEFPREVAEAALAHKVGNAVEQAYRRSDALEKRRELMAAWSLHCCSG